MSRRAISLATGVPESGFGRLAWAAGGAAGVTTGNDAQNTFITLTALGIDPSCYVVARCNEPADQLLHEGDAVLVLTTHDSIDELEEHWSRII